MRRYTKIIPGKPLRHHGVNTQLLYNGQPRLHVTDQVCRAAAKHCPWLITKKVYHGSELSLSCGCNRAADNRLMPDMDCIKATQRDRGIGQGKSLPQQCFSFFF